ncbi:uncharacterized protein (TIGR02001 family) [Alteromonadaceae bacterium 2753L.S.0a.02]|nr:uncharacterized protein (TIGR02001 family) [Alteromonadaceae bacterium 2753L.S.0a.02]
MKMSKKVLAGAVAASLAVSAMAPVANAEVSGSVGIASSYLWRGIDLGAGSGTPAVSGDLNYSASGFYLGTWMSSGDASLGTEYDLYIGYGNSIGEMFSFDISLWSYQYPTAVDDDGEEASPDIGKLMEGVLALGFGPVTATYYHGVEDLEDYWYATLDASFSSFNIKYGQHEDDMAHVDLTYSYNDNLAFTISQVVNNPDDAYNDDTNLVVSYSLPIE